jgi:nucleoside-diphosphate-sugar epimerase
VEPSEHRTVLITGASGLIGTALMRDLARDHHVVGLDLRPPGRLPEHGSFLACDLTDDAAVRATFDRIRHEHGDRIASVIHLAAHYDFTGAPSPLYEQLTVAGTRRLLRELQSLRVEQFVFSSTVLVMKEAEPGEVITESSPLEAEWDYPRSKIEAERVIREHRGSIPAVILRLAGVYDEHGHSPPLTHQIQRIRERRFQSHLFPGDEDRGQPFVHLDDVVSAFRTTVEHRNTLPDFEVMFIAEPEVATYGRLQDRLGMLIHGKNWRTVRVPGAIAKAGAWLLDKLSPSEQFIKPWMIDLADAHFPVSPARAEQVLGWRARHRLDDSLPAMIRNLQRDPEAFYRENRLAA